MSDSSFFTSDSTELATKKKIIVSKFFIKSFSTYLVAVQNVQASEWTIELLLIQCLDGFASKHWQQFVL